MATSQQVESWEQLKLENLSLSDKKHVETAGSLSTTAPQHSNQQITTNFNGTRQPSTAVGSEAVVVVDSAILQALADPNQRITALRIEELVCNFITNPEDSVLEFPSTFSAHQRLLAHRIAQRYGLHTSTADYEGGRARVVAHRSAHAKILEPKLSQLDVGLNGAAAAPTGATPETDRGASPKVLLKRPSGTDLAQQATANGGGSAGNSGQNLKERQEDYHRTREQLLAGVTTTTVMYPDGGRGGRGFRGRAGPPFGGRADGGRGRKAVLRDKERDLSDPDYRRGMDRFNGTSKFDPNFAANMRPGGIYQVPTYQTEFPTLQSRSAPASQLPQQQPTPPHMQSAKAPATSWSGQQVRPPPPPPPPQQAPKPLTHSAASHSSSHPMPLQAYGSQTMHQQPASPSAGSTPAGPTLVPVSPYQHMAMGIYPQGMAPMAMGMYAQPIAPGMAATPPNAAMFTPQGPYPAYPGMHIMPGYGYMPTPVATGHDGATAVPTAQPTYPMYAAYPPGAMGMMPAPMMHAAAAGSGPMAVRPMTMYPMGMMQYAPAYDASVSHDQHHQQQQPHVHGGRQQHHGRDGTSHDVSGK